MADSTHLFGSCSCERNQYTILVKPQAVHVFFDNSSTYRRAQAAPVTAFLRVPLDSYQSTTTAYLPDETHATIKRVYHTPTSARHQTRRQFCGVCGTPLTAWEEGHGNEEYINVTLASLHEESLERLETLDLLPSDSDEETATSTGVREPAHDSRMSTLPVSTAAHNTHISRMMNRGLPYFEDMVEHSRLGRIRRQVAGRTSRDGSTTVQWEVIEIESDEPISDRSSPDSKRQKLTS